MAHGPGLLGSAALLALVAGVAVLAVTRGGAEDRSPRTPTAPAPRRSPSRAAAALAAPAPNGSISGTVVAGEYRLPDAGREVTLLRDGSPPRTATTDGWGRFRFDGVPSGIPVEVRVAAEGMAAEDVTGLTVLPGETRSVGALRLDRPALFRIEVVDGAGKPIEGATVDAYRETTGPLWEYAGRTSPQTPDVPSMTRTTDAEGHAIFEVAPMRETTFAASAPGRARVARAWNFRRAGVRDEIRLALPTPAPLSGHVLDADGRPSPRAVVVARTSPRVVDDHHGTRAEGPGLWTRADADAAGRFAFDALPPGQIELCVAAEGGVPVGWDVVDTRGVSEIELRVRPTGAIAGRVTDETTGAAVAGASVAVRASGAAWIAVTGEDGTYAIAGVAESDLGDAECVPPDGWTLPRARLAHAADRPHVEAGRELRLDWTVQRAATLEGRVTAQGAPVLGATVDVLRVPETLDDARWEADGRTDADGRYRIEDAPAGRLAVSATPPGASGYETRSAFRTSVIEDAAARALLVFDAAAGATTRRDAEVTLPAVDAEEAADAKMERMADRVLGERQIRFVCHVRTADGAPLRDARARVEPAEYLSRRSDGLLMFARDVPADGDFVSVERAKDGDQAFAVVAADLDHDLTIVRDVAVAADAKEVTVDVVLLPLPILRCRVASEGEPIAGAVVRDGRTLVARSAADGTFALRKRAGTCRLAVEAAGFVRHEFKDIDVPQDDVVELALEQAQSIDGIVVDAAGKPVAGVRVTPVDRRGYDVSPYGDDAWPSTAPQPPVTGADGRFRIAELPSGEFGLRISAASEGDAAVATVTSGPVASGTADVRLVARRASRIAGRVVDAAGKGVVRAKVFCAGDDEVTGEEDDRELRTGEDGAFEFAGLLEGKYRIDVRAVPRDELAPGRFRRTAGRSDELLALVPAGVISGSVLTPEGQPVQRAEVAAEALGAAPAEDVPPWEGRLECWGEKDGRFRLIVPPGRRYALAFARNSRAADDAVLRGGEDVAAGTEGLRLVAVSGLAIGGTAVSEKGKPVWDADVEVRTKEGSVRRYRTGGDGRFKLSGFDPCTADVVVHAPGRVPRIVAGVTAGTSDLVLVLPVGDSITGRLLDAKGEPATGWKIRARRVADPATDLWRADVRRDGAFSIPGLDDGEWTFDAIAEGCMTIEKSVPLGNARTGARDLQFKLGK